MTKIKIDSPRKGCSNCLNHQQKNDNLKKMLIRERERLSHYKLYEQKFPNIFAALDERIPECYIWHLEEPIDGDIDRATRNCIIQK